MNKTIIITLCGLVFIMFLIKTCCDNVLEIENYELRSQIGEMKNLESRVAHLEEKSEMQMIINRGIDSMVRETNELLKKSDGVDKIHERYSKAKSDMMGGCENE